MNFIFRFLLTLCACSLVVLTGCDVPFAKEDPVVVSVGEAKLRESEIRRVAPEWDSWTDREKLTFLEHWIDEETIDRKVLLSSGVKYDTSLPAILDLQENGVSDRIIQTMCYHSEFDKSLNNQGVINMVKAGISEDIIQRKVLLASGIKFDMSAEAIKHLKDNGVSSDIIQTMMYHAK